MMMTMMYLTMMSSHLEYIAETLMRMIVQLFEMWHLMTRQVYKRQKMMQS
jgi:hypothetical protein